MRAVRFCSCVLAVLFLATSATFAAQRGMPEDIGGVPEEKAFKEEALALPAYPAEPRLIEFKLRGSSRNRYYIDRDSLSLGEDRVVRYAMVIRTPGGASNVSYEGLRCKTAEYKVYAFGNTEGKWINSRKPEWQSVGASVGNFRFGLWVDYLCDAEAVRGRNVADLVANLKGVAPYRSDTTKE
jgi:hypothetical protein